MANKPGSKATVLVVELAGGRAFFDGALDYQLFVRFTAKPVLETTFLTFSKAVCARVGACARCVDRPLL